VARRKLLSASVAAAKTALYQPRCRPAHKLNPRLGHLTQCPGSRYCCLFSLQSATQMGAAHSLHRKPQGSALLKGVRDGDVQRTDEVGSGSGGAGTEVLGACAGLVTVFGLSLIALC